jgi:hypothetical protein
MRRKPSWTNKGLLSFQNLCLRFIEYCHGNQSIGKQGSFSLMMMMTMRIAWDRQFGREYLSRKKKRRLDLHQWGQPCLGQLHCFICILLHNNARDETPSSDLHATAFSGDLHQITAVK